VEDPERIADREAARTLDFRAGPVALTMIGILGKRRRFTPRPDRSV